jgi:hypothetical protein
MDYLLSIMEGGSFSFCVYTLLRWQNKQSRLQQMIDFVQKSSVLTPSMLRKAMEPNGPDYLLKSIKNFEEGKNYSMGMAFVQGIVESEQVIRSVLNHSTKLVLSSVSSELIFSNNKNFEEADGKVDTKYVSEFKLADPSTMNESLLLNNTSNVQFGDALHLIHSIVHMRSLSPLEKFLSWILFCIKLFLSMSNVGKKLSGFKVGTKRVERGIMLGQLIIAFGEVVFDRYSKQLRMSNPLFFLKEKDQIVYKLREQKIALSRNMALLSSVVIALGFLLVKRGYNCLMSIITEYQRVKNVRNLDNFYRLNQLYTNDFKCAICSDSVRNVIFKPCLHMLVCSRCCEKIPEKKCPVCRKPIDDTVIVFVS